MKKYSLIAGITVILISLFIPAFSVSRPDNRLPVTKTGQFPQQSDIFPSVSAVRSVLIEAESGQVLYGKREYEKAGMASTTKIMTALVVLNNLSLDTVFRIPKQCIGIEGSSIYFVEGEKLRIEELLYGLLLASGNDCAVALALACSGSVDAFVLEMNKTARDLGIEDTHFTNPHGLSDRDHYTSCYSLALITAEAMKNRTFREIVSTKTAKISYNNKTGQRTLVNHNRLLSGYKGTVGVKTGFTKATGRCLVTAAERDGILLIAVTLNDGNDWNSHRNMFDYGFSNYQRVILAGMGDIRTELSVVGGKERFVGITNTQPASAVLLKGTEYKCRIVTPRFLYAPVTEGEIAGYAEFFDKQGLIYRLPLKTVKGVEYRKLSFFEKIFGTGNK